MNWKLSESTERPKKVEISGDMAYIRKNIRVITREETTLYSYEECYCTKDIAINYLVILNEELEVENAYNNRDILDLDFRVSELEG